mgnify:CR=1 FL=1
MHFLKLYGGGYLAMSKAKQAQLNSRILHTLRHILNRIRACLKNSYALTGAIAPGEKAESGGW